MLTNSPALAHSKASATFFQLDRVETVIQGCVTVSMGLEIVKGVPWLCFGLACALVLPSNAEIGAEWSTRERGAAGPAGPVAPRRPARQVDPGAEFREPIRDFADR